MATSNVLRVLCNPALAATLIAVVLATPEQILAAGGGDDDAPPSEYSLAKQALAQLHEKDPNDANVLNLLGYGYRKIDNLDQSRGYYLQALGVDPQHRGANEYLGELYLETVQVDKAEERLAVLDKDCWLGCSEYTELKESIEKYKAEKGIQ